MEVKDSNEKNNKKKIMMTHTQSWTLQSEKKKYKTKKNFKYILILANLKLRQKANEKREKND